LANLFTFTVYKTHIYIDLISVCSMLWFFSACVESRKTVVKEICLLLQWSNK